MSDIPKRLTREEYIEAILVYLYQSDEVVQHITAIAEGIGVAQATVTKYLYFMLDKYLKEQIIGQSKCYYLTDEGRKRAQEILEKREKEPSK